MSLFLLFFFYWSLPLLLLWIDNYSYQAFNSTLYGLRDVRVLTVDTLLNMPLKSIFGGSNRHVALQVLKFGKNLEFFFYKINFHYHIWIVPTSGVPQITLEGFRDQNLRGGALSAPPVQSRVKQVLESYELPTFWKRLRFYLLHIQL